MNTHEKTPGSRLIEAAKEAVETAKVKPTGAVWHFMSPQAVAAYGPWIRKEDHDAIVQSQAARIAELEAAVETLGEYANAYDGLPAPKYFGDTDFGLRYSNSEWVKVSLGDLRAARSLTKDRQP